jgi:glycosyltransferase involved in cell wall biosynthesis
VSDEALVRYYNEARVFVYAAHREPFGLAPLEAMACGTPVVASPIWGNPEVVQSREAGLIARENTPEAIALAVRDLLADPPDRAATRAYAERFGWEATTEGQIALYRRVLAARGQPC